MPTALMTRVSPNGRHTVLSVLQGKSESRRHTCRPEWSYLIVQELLPHPAIGQASLKLRRQIIRWPAIRISSLLWRRWVRAVSECLARSEEHTSELQSP